MKSTLSENRLIGLWRMMSGYRLAYGAATVAQGIAASSKMLTYLLLKYFIDQVLTPHHYEKVPLIALGFVGLALVEGSCTFLSGSLAARTAEGIARRLRNYLFDHIQRLSFKFHSETPTGELIQRCTSDVDAVRRFFADQAISVGRTILLFIINFLAIYSLNPKLAFISVVVVPIILGVSVFFFKRITKIYENYQEQEAVLSNVLQENLTGVRVVKAYARQPYEMEKFEKENIEKFNRGRKMAIMHSFFWPISDTICGMQMLGGFVVGALMTIHGDITIGTYMAYAGLVVWIIFPLRNLGRLIVQTSTGLVSFARVSKIIREDREDLHTGMIASPADIKGAVSFDRVSFEYEPGNPILKEVSFACQPGQVVALLGSTGSGKTSLVNLLPRFYDPTGGMITLDGRDLCEYSRYSLRQLIGIVEQEPFLFSRSIRDNITYGVGHDVTDEEVYEAARAAAIHDVIISFPDGYKTLVGEKGVTLSGGQKQRVAIARTLLKNPRILILDDSTSSVDLETEAEIRTALEHLMRHRTTFIIAHRIQSIMDADQILVFDKGEIVERGIHEDLLAANGMYRQIYDLQTRIDTELEQEIQSVRL
jgi:ATP-binding cassette subfamily B protein